MDATCLFLKRTSIIGPGVFLFGERVSGVFLRTLDLHHGCLFSVLSQSKYMDGRINRACTRGEGVLVVTDSFTLLQWWMDGGCFFLLACYFPFTSFSFELDVRLFPFSSLFSLSLLRQDFFFECGTVRVRSGPFDYYCNIRSTGFW